MRPAKKIAVSLFPCFELAAVLSDTEARRFVKRNSIP